MYNSHDRDYLVEMGRAAQSGGDMIVAGKFVESDLAIAFGEGKEKTPEFKKYFLENYKSIIPMYLSDGRPSADTLRSYCCDIDIYLKWCAKYRIDPFMATRRDIIIFRADLMEEGLKSTTIRHRLIAVHRFYYVLKDFGLVDRNPSDDIKAHREADSADITFKFFDVHELKKIIHSFDGKDDIKSLRGRAMVMLMGLEGLRTVEIHRMNAKDVNFVTRTLYIRGKGHNDSIVIRKDTAEALKEYMRVRTTAPDETPVPVFVSCANNSRGRRITRKGIRQNINEIFRSVDLYEKGHSGHTLRHTAGTLLYDATKDLNYVKTALRHKDLVMASRYSHVIRKPGDGLSNVIDLGQ